MIYVKKFTIYSKSKTLIWLGLLFINKIKDSNDSKANLEAQKKNIANHLRTHGHFCSAEKNSKELKLINEGEIFSSVKFPSKFEIYAEFANVEGATRICNDMMDLLLSDKVSFEVGDMKDPKDSKNLNSFSCNRFLLFANLAGHHIKGLAEIPGFFNENIKEDKCKASSYVQLVVSAQKKFMNQELSVSQIITITLFPAKNRDVNAADVLPPVYHSQIARLRNFIITHKKNQIAVITLCVFCFVIYKILNTKQVVRQ